MRSIVPLNMLLLALLAFGCQQPQEPSELCPSDSEHLFTLLPSSQTQIDFQNELNYTEEFNAYTYRNFYNGAGLGIGDLNNDGLADIFFCGNMVSNRLYLNRGDFRFEDVTDQATLNSEGVWSTGVSLADVNGDGWLDIYVCKAGKPEGDNRHNELFINQGVDENGVPVFTEQAKQYGIADYGLSTHAAFFDYDKDGDLDMYLLNNSLRSVGVYDLRKNQRTVRDPNGGNKLYRNDGKTFTDVSEAAGIYGSAIGFGLGVTIGDVNKDGWQDIFISNDFFEKDYLYLNQQDGTFKESLEDMIGEISLGSMGADMADINNDGFPEIFVTEMLPDKEARLKTKTLFEDWNKYRANQQAGYHRQFPRNVLQLNRGIVPDKDGQSVVFSEIARFSGVSATDWSWGALMADLDNDGYKDIYVANGIYKDLIDLDYLNFYADPIVARRLYEERGAYLKELIDQIPSNALPNYAFQNNQDLTFGNVTEDWGLSCPSFSNGSVYGDLDNDGDLDLVVSNVNMPPFVLRNNAERIVPDNNHLTFELKGTDKNTYALGTQITVKYGDKTAFQELAPMRGYQSTVDSRLHFGLGTADQVDSVIIVWPDQRVEILTDVPVNQSLQIQQEKKDGAAGQNAFLADRSSATLFYEVSGLLNESYSHQKSDFVDFNRDPLLFHMIITQSPQVTAGDVDGNGAIDFYIGGGVDQPGRLYLQNRTGQFRWSDQPAFENDRYSEDAGSAFFDADQDGDLDLYVCSGGNEFTSTSSVLLDRLYFNDGSGRFTRSEQELPSWKYENTSCVEPADFDGDGDMDLFVGVRAKPFLYGEPANGYLLVNNGQGQLQDQTERLAPELINLGMITDACWLDVDADGDQDLAIAGDWMPIRFFENHKGQFKEITEQVGLTNTNGFWNCLETADLDGDGDPDLVAGNRGKNTRIQASTEKPATLYVNDFDGNGKVEQIITTYNGEKAYPLVMLTDLVRQLPMLKKKYPKYSAYKEQTIEDIFGEEQVAQSLQLKSYTTLSTCFLYDNGKFVASPLPAEAQLAPVFALDIQDFNNDQKEDLLIGGNFYWSKPEVGIYDALKGLFLSGQGNGRYEAVSPSQSGFYVEGEIRDFHTFRTRNGYKILVTRYNDEVLFFNSNAQKNET